LAFRDSQSDRVAAFTHAYSLSFDFTLAVLRFGSRLRGRSPCAGHGPGDFRTPRSGIPDLLTDEALLGTWAKQSPSQMLQAMHSDQIPGTSSRNSSD
jgi:hypothetical protein